jgi:hypothetical protein
MLHFAQILCYPDDHRCGTEAFCAWLFPLSVKLVELKSVPSTTQLEGLSALDNFQLLAVCSSH